MEGQIDEFDPESLVLYEPDSDCDDDQYAQLPSRADSNILFVYDLQSSDASQRGLSDGSVSILEPADDFDATGLILYDTEFESGKDQEGEFTTVLQFAIVVKEKISF